MSSSGPVTAKASTAMPVRLEPCYSHGWSHEPCHQLPAKRLTPYNQKARFALQPNTQTSRQDDIDELIRRAIVGMKHDPHQGSGTTTPIIMDIQTPVSMKKATRSKPDNVTLFAGKMQHPSLLATHPAQYKQQRSLIPRTKTKETRPHRDATTITCAPLIDAKLTPAQATPVKFPPSLESKNVRQAPPRMPYNDPKRLQSKMPQFSDPKFRMLKMDINPHQPKVISPGFMIALPLGGMVEGANVYPDDRRIPALNHTG